MSIINFCSKVIEYSFYALFLLVPLVFSGNTSELFELNKMWLTWGLTITIGASWFTKMILQRRILLCRTPLDIPILLFLASQLISTIFSWDRHTSFWGYYSRFNGGFLSTLTYVFLYYAFVSNFVGNIKVVWRIIYVSLISGLIVALWGLPSHFGYDPTCFIFRGTFDVSCWTADFLPKVRIFSTLGQPAWLAAYLAVLIPISIVMFLNNSRSQNTPKNRYHVSSIMYYVSKKSFIHATCYILLATLFYIDLLYTQARGGILGLWFSLAFFFLAYGWLERKNIKKLIVNRQLSIVIGVFLLITFIIGPPIPQLYGFTFSALKNHFTKPPLSVIPQGATKEDADKPPSQPTVSGGTESGDIRLLVWQGGMEAWRHYPIFGTGVETFAFAYYKYKPIGQNSVSEWNFLYNKAHNEYVNYLATTGLFGLGSYLFMIGTFIFLFLKGLNPKSEIRPSTHAQDALSLSNGRNPKQYQNSNDKNSKRFEHSNLENSNLFRVSIFDIRILNVALLSSYISILISNFFGFSVVIMNLYLFLIPAFVLILNGMIKHESGIKNYESRNLYQWVSIFCIILASLFMILTLFRFWRADISYKKGFDLNRVGEYLEANEDFHKAVELRGDEPTFKDELAVNEAILAVALLKDPSKKNDPETLSSAANLVQEAIAISDQIISENPNNVVFWKSRVRLFFTLSQLDNRFMEKALTAIEKAFLLAPNDANVIYNLGVLYGQNNNLAKGIEALEKTVALKPDYLDAHYALGLFYHSFSMDDAQKIVVNKDLYQKGVDQIQYILTHIDSKHTPAIDLLKEWEKQ